MRKQAERFVLEYRKPGRATRVSDAVAAGPTLATRVDALEPDDALFVSREGSVETIDLVRLRNTLRKTFGHKAVTVIPDHERRGVWLYRRADGRVTAAIGPDKEAEVARRALRPMTSALRGPLS